MTSRRRGEQKLVDTTDKGMVTKEEGRPIRYM